MPTALRPSTTVRGYGNRHQAIRREFEPLVRAGGVRCARCGELIAPTAEWHLGHTDDRRGYIGPEHVRCNVRAASAKAAAARWAPPPPPEPEPERDGIGPRDARWKVPWLKGLRRPPADAVWPRYMTAPHPNAVGSLGAMFVKWAKAREGRELRWWQRLVAARLLEVDVDGRLVWGTMILTVPRQLGKSWLLRELLLWRMHQQDVFGEPQDVMHIGKDLQVCKEILLPALRWADAQPGYKTGRAAGEMYIERELDHSRWMLRAKTSINGYAASVAAVDEAWKVPAETVTDLTPILTARTQPQLWLISTAHRQATSLMLARRKAALERLEVDTSTLLMEWSTPRAAPIDDARVWRASSPHWTPQRERLMREELEACSAGEADVYEDELDPVEGFRAQWLNQWPERAMGRDAGEPLLPAGLWSWLAEPGLRESGPLHLALEDNFGNGAAVAVCAELVDGRLEVDGWLRPDWDAAVADVVGLAETREIRVLQVGASLLGSVPEDLWPRPAPAGGAETRVGLAVLRDLAAAGRVVHDPPADHTRDLDDAIGAAQVRELSTGLTLAPGGTGYLVKALAWAVASAHAREPEAAIY